MKDNQFIGDNLKKLRLERQLSLGQLAKLCDVSKVILSQIERGESNPTVNTIWKIANGLKVHYTELLDYEGEEETVAIVKREDASLQSGQDEGYKSYSYYKHSQTGSFDFFLIEIMPGKQHHIEGHLLGSKEYVYVCKGKVSMKIGDETFELNQGDSFSFDGSLEHTYSNIGHEIAECVSIVDYS